MQCYLHLGMIGINYKTADLVLREAVARGAQSLAGEKRLFFRHPTILLSTCNRTEIYFSAEDLSEAHNDLLSFLRQQIQIPFEQKLYSFFGLDCFTHLCRVTAGLDSAILAETEIQRQVKGAYAEACEILALPSCVHYVFQKALRVAKTARSCFFLERGALFEMLWRLATEVFSDLSKKRILLVGYSEVNRRFFAFLERRRVFNVKFCTKTGHGCSREELLRWHAYDLICCATKADGYLIQGEGRKKHLIFDLSVPRNVDPKIRGNVLLYNIEQIDQLIEQKRTPSLEQSEIFVEQYALRLARLYREKAERIPLPIS